MDFCKAFDSTSHVNLYIAQNESVGIPGRTIELSSLKKLYRYDEARVSINGWVSEEILCNVGVRPIKSTVVFFVY